MHRSSLSRHSVPWLLALVALIICVPALAEAISFTSSFQVDLTLSDPDLPGGGVFKGQSGPSDQPVLNVAVSDVETTTSARTLSAQSSVSATVSLNGGGISSGGAAQVDGRVDPVGPNTGSLTFGAFGHASFQLNFMSDANPMMVDISAMLHRSGALWAGLDSSLIDLSCNPFVAAGICAAGGERTDGFPAGDFPFEFHGTMPPDTEFRFAILAEVNLFSFSGLNFNRQTTSESQITWNLQARPIPAPPTYLLFGLGIIGLAIANWRRG